jgi:hypothetical protein
MATIYTKTADGQNEIETRARRITPRLRSALILVDGKRTDVELAGLIQQAEETLKALLDGGLIEVTAVLHTKTTQPKPAPASEPAPAAPAVPDKNFETLRRDAVRAINDQLGPSGESLALKIERAADPEELRAALERAVAYIANARGGGAAAQFASRFLPASPN